LIRRRIEPRAPPVVPQPWTSNVQNTLDGPTIQKTRHGRL